MVFERDESGVRDARENLQDAQDEIAIAALEKQIKLIEEDLQVRQFDVDFVFAAFDAVKDHLGKLLFFTLAYGDQGIWRFGQPFHDVGHLGEVHRLDPDLLLQKRRNDLFKLIQIP